MKNKILLIITSIIYLNSFAQEYKVTRIENTDFILSCKCIEVVNKYNNKKGTYNYAYETKDRQNGYMISTRKVNMSDESKTAFLNSVKSAGVLDFIDTYFLDNKAIMADFKKGNYYAKQIGFFNKNKSYTITIIGNSKKSINSLYENLVRTFKVL